MSAVEQANNVMDAMGWQARVGCSCGGYWWYEQGEPRGATHAQDCAHADASPPDFSSAAISSDTTGAAARNSRPTSSHYDEHRKEVRHQ